MSSLLKNPVVSQQPLSQEDLGQTFGFVVYRTRLGKDVALGELKFENVNDYANVLVNGKLADTLDRRKDAKTLKIEAKASDTPEVVVENMGRLNFGKDLSSTVKVFSERLLSAIKN